MLHHLRTRATALAAAVLLLSPAIGYALDYVSSAQLADRCRAYVEDPKGENGRFCAAYVRGFIDGSPTVVIQASQSPGSEESFAQRAARTRLGRPVSARPEHCIDGSLPMKIIVEQIVALANESAPRDDVDASVLLYAAFDRFHQCVS
jgi:hypothetical protein